MKHQPDSKSRLPLNHLRVQADQSRAKRTVRRIAPAALRRDTLADALWAEHHRIGAELESLIPKLSPNFDTKKLHADYKANAVLWKGFCGFALYLDGGRKVRVEVLARIVATLFWVSLLLSHGFFAPAIDLTEGHEGSRGARRWAFRRLWLFLYRVLSPSANTNPAPTRRASYEIAKVMLPGVATDFDRDREALKHFERWLRRRSERHKGVHESPH